MSNNHTTNATSAKTKPKLTIGELDALIAKSGPSGHLTQPELETLLAWLGEVRDELGDDTSIFQYTFFDPTPFRCWLYDEKAVRDLDTIQRCPGPITPALFAEWQKVKATYKPKRTKIDYLEGVRDPERDRLEAEARAKEAAEKARHTARAEAAARTEAARLECVAAKLKAHVFEPIILEPINYATLALHRKNPGRARKRLLEFWLRKYQALPDAVRTAWDYYFDEVECDVVMVPVTDADSDDADPDADDTEATGSTYAQSIRWHPSDRSKPLAEWLSSEPDIVARGLRDPTFEVFRRYSEGCRRAYDLLDESLIDLIDPPPDPDPETGVQTIDEISDERKPDLVPEVIPHGVTFIVGPKDAGKSAFTHKLGQCVASESTNFEGIDIEHGPVLLCTLDNGASAVDTKPRLITIRKRLGLPSSHRFTVADDALYLNEPSSVEHFMETHRCPTGPYKLLTIDPLNEAVSPGSSLQSESLISDVKAGLKKLRREGFAECITIVTHPPKGGGDDPFGSVFQGTTANGIIKVERTGDDVTARVIRNKNGRPRAEPFRWRMDPDDGFLISRNERTHKPGRPAKDTAPADTEALHAKIAATLPMGPIRSDAALKLIGDLIPGAQAVRKVLWQRIREAMADAGLIAVRKSDGERRQPPIIERLR